jgi:excisionase family DNA binding protein
LLSTKEVADLLNVAETTVKRWTDEQTLPCIKTPGGHRKFVASDIVAFGEQHQYPLTGLIPPPISQKHRDELQLGVQTQNHQLLAGVFLDAALQGDREDLREILTYLYTNQISFTDIADNIIRRAMEEIGKRWGNGSLEVNQEHRASQAVLEALHQFGPKLHRKSPNGLTAVCSCVEGELHSTGLQCVAYALEAAGWNVYMLGASTPYDTLRSYVNRLRPALVCLSSTNGRVKKEPNGSIRSLTRAVHKWDGVVVVGGQAASHLTAKHFGCDFVAGSLQEGLATVRDHFQLKPGPKKSRPSKDRKTRK